MAVLYLSIGSRCLVASVFIVSAITKLRNRAALASFVQWLREFELVPDRAVGAVAASVAATELVIPVLVLPPITAVAGLVAAAALLAIFGAGIAIALSRNRRTPCRCFGASGTPLGAVHLIRNAILLVCVVSGLVGVADPGVIHAGEAAIAALAGLIAAGLLIRLDDLVDLFRSPPAAPSGPRARRPD